MRFALVPVGGIALPSLGGFVAAAEEKEGARPFNAVRTVFRVRLESTDPGERGRAFEPERAERVEGEGREGERGRRKWAGTGTGTEWGLLNRIRPVLNETAPRARRDRRRLQSRGIRALREHHHEEECHPRQDSNLRPPVWQGGGRTRSRAQVSGLSGVPGFSRVPVWVESAGRPARSRGCKFLAV